MELVLIEIGSKDWDYMWDWLGNHPINKGIDNPTGALNNEQSWQYMGSLKQGDKLISRFRHRCHPYNNNTINLSMNHPTDSDISTAKTFKL